MPVISNGNAMGERGGSSHSTERERGGGSHSTVEERGGSSSGDGVPVKDARATADGGGVRPDWGSEQVGCVVPFLWEVGRVTVCPLCRWWWFLASPETATTTATPGRGDEAC